MRAFITGGLAAAFAFGTAGAALAQDAVVAERRAGLRDVGQHMEAIGALVQGRGDQRQAVARLDEVIAFFRTLPDRVPAQTLAPPVPQGTGAGQTRALAAIEANRADFNTRTQTMLAALTTLRGAAEQGAITPDLLRSTGGACAACHQQYRAR